MVTASNCRTCYTEGNTSQLTGARQQMSTPVDMARKTVTTDPINVGRAGNWGRRGLNL